MGNKIVIFMLVLAVFVTALGFTNSVDFFGATSYVLDTVSSLTDPLLEGISVLFVGDRFDSDDIIEVVRYFFDDGHYCDIGRKLHGNYVFDSVARYTFLYSTNENVFRYKQFGLLNTITFRYSFTDASGEDVYSFGMFKNSYHWSGTYYDYCLDYQKDSSVDGWTKFNVIPLG